jgi:deazaflavin-dependent oxidoreductase (nitroreductase family)
MSTSPADFNAKIIDEFRATGGRVGGMFESMPLLLLHHTGAKSGKQRVNPLAYQRDGDRYVIFASKAGAPTNPDWYHNLKAHPEVAIEVGTETINVVTSEATDDERERLFPRSGGAIASVRRVSGQDRSRDPGDQLDADLHGLI